MTEYVCPDMCNLYYIPEMGETDHPTWQAFRTDNQILMILLLENFHMTKNDAVAYTVHLLNLDVVYTSLIRQLSWRLLWSLAQRRWKPALVGDIHRGSIRGGGDCWRGV